MGVRFRLVYQRIPRLRVYLDRAPTSKLADA